MRISDQLHAMADLSPENFPQLPLNGKLGDVHHHSGVSVNRKILASSGKRTAIPRTSIP